MSQPEISVVRPLGPALNGWSRGQAVAQLCALLGAGLAHAAWPVALGALGSFGVLLYLARRAYTPRGRFGWANRVTLLRLVVLLTLTAPTSWLSARAALGLVSLVLALDLLDGFLARALGDASSFGAHFDMESDAQLVLVVTLHLWLAGSMGFWVLFAGSLRYLYVLALWLWPSRAAAREAPRSRFARYSFAILMAGLCGALILPPPLSSVSACCGTLVVSWSFARSSYFSWRELS